ncbi:replication factor A protein 3 [Truncatella angustata]|uniref:Replication factor A protein 3 n=1 Tax=Truncatella angustata TaxID=152316 RepID=A0A9P8UFL6_9PEZI|nr:replication factor A protein 3 [Truncatella angustata]KAH6649019.1 replication factor A protein 3 [Truncatella angustata]
MESVSTPRISSRYIDSYVGRTVMVVGKVIQLRGNEALIDSDGQINVNLNPQCHLTPGNGVQVIGKVSSDLTIKVMSSVDLGDNVDYSISQSVVDVTHQYKELFVYEQ